MIDGVRTTELSHHTTTALRHFLPPDAGALWKDNPVIVTDLCRPLGAKKETAQRSVGGGNDGDNGH